VIALAALAPRVASAQGDESVNEEDVDEDDWEDEEAEEPSLRAPSVGMPNIGRFDDEDEGDADEADEADEDIDAALERPDAPATRATPEALQAADAFFASLSGSAANGAVLTAERTGHTAAWPQTAAAAALFRHWEKAAAAMGLAAAPVPRGGLSDANHLWRLGPTLDGLGPWGGNAHCSVRSADGSTLPEYLETKSLVPKAVMNAGALMDLLASK
jgi:acetylornithine deacetylase/succinyl-diaminopimelate desuccinylase-like protein